MTATVNHRTDVHDMLTAAGWQQTGAHGLYRGDEPKTVSWAPRSDRGDSMVMIRGEGRILMSATFEPEAPAAVIVATCQAFAGNDVDDSTDLALRDLLESVYEDGACNVERDMDSDVTRAKAIVLAGSGGGTD